eukprot:3581266-Karenia_brevis.AAC.1
MVLKQQLPRGVVVAHVVVQPLTRESITELWYVCAHVLQQHAAAVGLEAILMASLGGLGDYRE